MIVYTYGNINIKFSVANRWVKEQNLALMIRRCIQSRSESLLVINSLNIPFLK